MKSLLTLILLLCTLTSQAQNNRRATVQPDTLSYNVDLAKVPNLQSANLQFSREESRRRRWHSGLVLGIVGVSVAAGGVTILAIQPNGYFYDLLGPALFKVGSGVTLIGGCLMLSSIRSHHHDRYSIVLHPNGIGLAYNF